MREYMNFSCPCDIHAPGQGFLDNAHLQCHIMRLSRRVSQWKVEKNSPGWFDCLSDVVAGGHRDGGNAVFFHLSCDQSDGLMADWSGGDQEKQIHLILFQMFNHFRDHF